MMILARGKEFSVDCRSPESIRRRSRNQNRAIVICMIAPIILLTQANAQTSCPPYTHKDTVLEGKAADLPAGFYLFSHAGQPGIYRSPIDTFQPVMVPGTENDMPGRVDISDDGKWVLYTRGTIGRNGALAVDTAYLVGLQNQVKVGVPESIFVSRVYSPTLRETTTVYTKPAVVGFMHGSPKGNEIFYYGYYMGGDWAVHGLPVDLSGGTPVFGAERFLLNYDTSATPRRIWPYAGANTVVAAKNGIFGLFGSATSGPRGPATPNLTYNEFITIPDSGNAGVADFYKWAALPDSSLWGCGQTMSHDGALCLTNTNAVGSPCIPNTRQTPTMDHKGFYITPFFRPTDPPMLVDQQIDSAGISINWCPMRFRVGTYDQCGFNEWSFANFSDYIIGESEGSLAPTLGVWVIQWKTNTWTLLTPNTKTTSYATPAIFITDRLDARARAKTPGLRMKTAWTIAAVPFGGNRIELGPGVQSCKIYTLAGKLLWKFHKNNSDGLARYQMPATVQKNFTMMKFSE